MALCLVPAVWSQAQEGKKAEDAKKAQEGAKKAQEGKKAEEARKAKLNELMKRVRQEFSQAECVFCHEETSPNIVKEYRKARDGEPTNTECASCAYGSSGASSCRAGG